MLPVKYPKRLRGLKRELGRSFQAIRLTGFPIRNNQIYSFSRTQVAVSTAVNLTTVKDPFLMKSISREVLSLVLRYRDCFHQ